MNRRPRRNRSTQYIRDLAQEYKLSTDDLVYPMFLLEGENRKVEINTMPGIYRYTKDFLLREIDDCLKLGIKAFCIFPVVEETYKDSTATKSFDPSFFYLTSLRSIKETFPEAFILTDVAMDPYNKDGHDGLVKNGKILNDETLEILAKMSLAQAQCGIDYLGLSDMMDGRVKYIREYLDEHNYTSTGILSYTAKYASAFYGPFREALNSSPKFGDKKTYQMNPANSNEALLEAILDMEEGADILMVKPALAYLDIIALLKKKISLPIASYNVSGEYSMLMAAIQKGWLKEAVILETLLSMKRAGSDMIFTYFAKQVAK